MRFQGAENKQDRDEIYRCRNNHGPYGDALKDYIGAIGNHKKYMRQHKADPAGGEPLDPARDQQHITQPARKQRRNDSPLHEGGAAAIPAQQGDKNKALGPSTELSVVDIASVKVYGANNYKNSQASIFHGLQLQMIIVSFMIPYALKYLNGKIRFFMLKLSSV